MFFQQGFWRVNSRTSDGVSAAEVEQRSGAKGCVDPLAGTARTVLVVLKIYRHRLLAITSEHKGKYSRSAITGSSESCDSETGCGESIGSE